MQFEWCNYGRDALFNERPSYIRCRYTIGGHKHALCVTDHTGKEQRDADLLYSHDISHAYTISGLRDDVGDELCKQMGFELEPITKTYCYFEPNKGFIDGTSKHQFLYEPDTSIEDLKKLIEDTIIKSFEIDFNEEMDKLSSKFKNSVLKLIEKKELMNEALSYQKERDSK